MDTGTPPELSKHDQKQQKRDVREDVRDKQIAETREQLLGEQRRKLFVYWGLFLAMVIGFSYWTYAYYSHAPDFRGGNVHWHTQLEMELCGKKVDLPRIGAGAHHRGLPLLHTHDDDVLHIEGYVSHPNDVTLGRFMDAVGVKFSDKTFFDKKEGDLCEGRPGKVRMWINKQESILFRDYSARDGDVVTIKFEP